MTPFAKMVAQVLPPRRNETDAQYASRVQAGCAVVEAFDPRDPVEQMLAVNVLGAHYAAIQCFQIALRPDNDFDTAKRGCTGAILMGRAMRDTMQLLKRSRKRAQPDPGADPKHVDPG